MDLNEILTKERDSLRDENIELRKLINELEWINVEVDFVPFWSLIIDSKRIKSVRGNVKMVKEII